MLSQQDSAEPAVVLVCDLRSARDQVARALGQAAAVAADKPWHPENRAFATSTRVALRRIESELANLAARWGRVAR